MTSLTSQRSLFRPCIDLHDGHVKQIVGGTLSETDPGSLKTNFVAKYAMVAAPGPPSLANLV
jgi:phosphoribosylformimino-5-aminoimidazole carboxamide ribotide isomerase